jgi:hypothetical protein
MNDKMPPSPFSPSEETLARFLIWVEDHQSGPEDGKQCEAIMAKPMLATVVQKWTVAIPTLPLESIRFQNLLAFFDATKIHEEVLVAGVPHLESDEFEFKFILNKLE